MLAVEIDGGIQTGAEQQVLDELRTQRLADLGIRVIRFSNEEVLDHLDEVLTRIKRAANSRKSTGQANKKDERTPATRGTDKT